MFPAELTVLQKQQQGQELANKMFSLENRDAISFGWVWFCGVELLVNVKLFVLTTLLCSALPPMPTNIVFQVFLANLNC